MDFSFVLIIVLVSDSSSSSDSSSDSSNLSCVCFAFFDKRIFHYIPIDKAYSIEYELLPELIKKERIS